MSISIGHKGISNRVRYNRQLDATTVNKALRPIFKGKEIAMIKTIFEEKYDAGVVDGETRAWRKAVVSALLGKFGKVPKGIEKTVQSMSDPVALESWLYVLVSARLWTSLPTICNGRQSGGCIAKMCRRYCCL